MTIQARRHSPRVRLNETIWINFGPGFGGVVLDVSEGGLQFKTHFPFRKSGSIKVGLEFSEGSDAVGDLVWTDESCTTGGLRFRSVPQEIHDQIRAWLDQSREMPRTRALARPANAAALLPRANQGAARLESKHPDSTETQTVTKAQNKPDESKLGNLSIAPREIPGSYENHLFMFQLGPTSVRGTSSRLAELSQLGAADSFKCF